ncbi:MAG TPA: adenylate/guanylate cyclase domain-containing protein [Dongiaceae bacterium]|nr:adenylate/guanylate cyclase domain-containing protein [Dongiaceae bacterium]
MSKERGILAQAWTRLQAVADILIPLVILIGALAIRSLDPTPIQYLRNVTFDTYQRLKPHVYDPDLPVRIAAIDEQSLKKFGQWPWPRTTLAMLINRLHQFGAIEAVVDVLFIEPDRTSPEAIIDRLPDSPELEAAKQALNELPSNDIVFAQSIRQKPNDSHPMPVVLAFSMADEDPKRTQDKPSPTGGFSFAGNDPSAFTRKYPYIVTPLPMLQQAAAGLGSVNVAPDFDGIIRRVPLVQRFESNFVPTLAAEALRVADGGPSYLLRSVGNGQEGFLTWLGRGIGQIKIGRAFNSQKSIATTPSGDILLYDTGHQEQRFFSIADLTKPDFDRSLVEGRIVLIGATVEGLNDRKPSPITPNMPGVEFHAMAIEQALATMLLDDRQLIRPYWAFGTELLYIFLFGSGMIVAVRRRGAWIGLGLTCMALAIAIIGSWYLFSLLRLQIDPIYPSATIFLIFVTGTMINFLRTERERRQVRNTFSLYLSPVMVDRLRQNPDRRGLGGEIRDLTIMFSDIRGFTKISESLDPQALTQLMNRYLTPMTDIIQKHQGTIDKYIGDCIMAFWNAPLDVPQHGREALLTAFEMRDSLARLNAEFQREAARTGRAIPEIRAGIGLNTGPGCVGNMGSEQRLAYTVLGDTVNTASRLEALSASYGVDLVIGHDTAAAAPDFALLELDQVRVKGKILPVRIFTALGDAQAADSTAFRELRARHIALLGAYRQCEWDVAAAALAACRDVAPAAIAGLYDLYERRIAEFRRHPPPDDWDGVYVAISKAG